MTTADGAAVPRSASVAAAEAAWRRTVRIWHLAFYGLVAVAALAIGTATSTPAERGAGLGAVGLLVVAYTVLGRPAANTGSRRAALAYLVILIGLTTVVVSAHPLGSILLFIAFSQIWFLADRRRTGVVLVVALTLCVWLGFAVRLDGARDELLSLAGQLTLSLAFSLMLGLWLSQVVEQSQERAVLVARLEEAQAELGRSHHAAGVVAERERLAREIHDTLAQGFTSVIMLAQTATADLDRHEDRRAAERVRLIERTARENLAEARALVAAFAPVDLQGGRLVEALTRLAERFTQETGVQVGLVVPEAAPALEPDAEVILLRTAQEALSNVRRHAEATHVRLVLRDGQRTGPEGTGDRAQEVALEVVDDGHGFDPATTSGLGLQGMRERVTAGGGAVEVASTNAGTRLRVTLPVTTAAGGSHGAAGLT
jgi:signal transduction histidine kinase